MGESLNSRREPPGAEQVFGALERLLTSDELRLSERNRRFLSFVVTQAIRGTADRIKAYTIGVDVFGRDEAFDPATDPIVRIEATRLRAALASYYEQVGSEAAVRISLPKGSYVPAFDWAALAHGAEAGGDLVEKRAGMPPLSAQVIVQDHTGRGNEDMAARAELFVDALAMTLQKASFTVHVVPPEERRAAADAIQAIYCAPHEALSLDIAVRPVDAKMRYSWRLGDLATGEVLATSFRDYVVASASGYEGVDDLAADATSAISAAIGLRRRAQGRVP